MFGLFSIRRAAALLVALPLIPGWNCGITCAQTEAIPARIASVAQHSPQRTARPKARPLPTDEERARTIEKLRELYSTDPSDWPAPELDPGVEHREIGPLKRAPHPEANPYSAAKRKLGELLFYDPRLSGSGQIACASCHDSDLGWADGRTASFGHNRRLLGRNSPSILNSGHRKTLFWDGRAPSLEQQAKDVLANADEMHSGDALFVGKLSEIPGYVTRFQEVFGVEKPTIDEVAMAIACFERSVNGSRTKFDAFASGRNNALTDEALVGLHLFRTDARCMNCHNGPLFSDDEFHNLGMTHYGRRFEDLGRYNVTEEPTDVGKFRTPSLRNVVNTSPYMHNGLLDLDEALLLYNAGMPNERRRKGQLEDPLFPAKSPLIKPLGLNEQDLSDLKAFLASLSEPHRRIPPPELPPGL